MSRRYLNELKEPPKHLECPACGSRIPYEEMFQHLLDHFNTKSNSNSPNVNEGTYLMKYNTNRQVLSEAWKITSTDKNGGDYHEHEHNIKDWFDAVARVAKKFIPFFTGRKFKVEPHNDVHEATEAPEYYEHIDDIDHEKIVKHAEDVIKRIDYILKIYDKHEHKLDNKQFKQVRKHKNQLNKIKTMITSELERHKKQALDEGIVDKTLLGLSGLTGGMALGAAAGGTIGALANSFGLPIDFEKAAYLGATVGGAYGPIHVSKIDTDAEASEAIWKYGEAIRNGKSKEVLDDLYNKQLRAANIHNSLVLLNSSKRRPYTKLHEESLLPNILKPSRNTDASGYARYISEQNSSSNLRSKPINEGHRHAGAIVGAAGGLIDLSSSAIALGAGVGATALTGNPAVGTATTIGVKALAVGDDAIKGWRQGRMTDIENGIRNHNELIKKHGDENHPKVLANKQKVNRLIAAHNTAFKRNDYATLNEAKFIKSTEHDYEPFNDKNAYRITDILKSKKFKHERSKGNSHIYVHGNGSKVLITKSGSGAITGLTHIDSNGKRTLFARKAEGVGQTEIDVKRFQKHLSSLNEGYKYTKVTPEGYEEHKAKILNLLSKYGKAYHHDLGGLAGPDDPEIQRHYEPGFFGRAFGLDKTDPKKHLSAFSTFRLDHPTDPNQHIEVAYTVGGEELYGWQPSAKTPHLISFSHHIKGHPRGDSDEAVYYSNSPRHTTANSDGFDEIFPQLKSYLKNNFSKNNPIVNVR